LTVETRRAPQRRKPATLKLYLSNEMRDLVREAATRDARTMQGYVERAIAEKLTRDGITPPPPTPDGRTERHARK
jgi:hypothetical protein